MKDTSRRFCLYCNATGCPCLQPPRLSPREVQVMQILAADSPANKEIAYRLGIGLGTVKQLIFTASSRLRSAGHSGVTNRTALAIWAHEHMPKRAMALGAAMPIPTEQYDDTL